MCHWGEYFFGGWGEKVEHRGIIKCFKTRPLERRKLMLFTLCRMTMTGCWCKCPVALPLKSWKPQGPQFIYIYIYVLYTHMYKYIVSHTVVSLIDETYWNQGPPSATSLVWWWEWFPSTSWWLPCRVLSLTTAMEKLWGGAVDPRSVSGASDLRNIQQWHDSFHALQAERKEIHGNPPFQDSFLLLPMEIFIFQHPLHHSGWSLG